MARRKKLTQDVVSEVMREMGRKGGRAKVAKGFAVKQLPKKARVANARKAVEARWAKVREQTQAGVGEK